MRRDTSEIPGPTMQEVRDFVKANPNMQPAEIVKAINCDWGRACNARHLEGVSRPSPRANSVPPKAGLKTVRISTIKAKDDRIAQLEEEVLELKTRPELNLEPKIVERVTYIQTDASVELEAEVKKLRAELSEARVVIAYLERKLHGTPV